jgi:dihydroxyacetone kinase-like protein
MQASKDNLNELDAAVGDGDLGITMSRGYTAVIEGLGNPSRDIGRVLFKAGVDFSNAAASTTGALVASAFMNAAKQMQGRADAGLAEITGMVKAAEEAIRAKGKAKPGDKTMLDAIVPAREAMEEALSQGLTLLAALQKALGAAEAGMLDTVGMKAAVGRARWLGERTVGHQDPGATAVFMQLEAVVAAIKRVTGSSD